MKNQIPFPNASKLALCLLLLVLVFAGTGQAASVRGRVDQAYANGQRIPMAGVIVTVSQPGRGRSAPSYTDGWGMYYLQNIRPGIYNLEIWSPNSPGRPIVYRIRVNEPYTDIPPVHM